MINFLLICIAISVVSFGYSYFQRQRDNRVFTGTTFVEGPVIKRLIDLVLPKEGTNNYIKMSDYMFVLDSRRSIRDVYLLKIICFACSIVIALSITVTNVINRRADALYVTTEMPISMTMEEYEILSQNVDFNTIKPETQNDIIKSNIGLIESKENAKKLNGINPEDLFSYLSIIHKSLSTTFGLLDIFIFLAILFVGWKIPSWAVIGMTSMLTSKELFEYDDLETDILMMSDQQVYQIIEALEKGSLFYREFFCRFRELYTENPEKAYQLVSSRHEFPEHFKKLVRYLNMIEVDGPNYVKVVIKSNKETTKEDVYYELRRIDKKREAILNVMIVAAFFLGLGRVFISLVAAYL